MATISSAGVGSGLDVNGIVTKLMTLEQRPITLLNQKEAQYQAQISAYGSIKGAVSSFQTALAGLSNASSFQNVTATPADATLLTASAASTAAAGSYSLNVTQLAQAQKLVAAGQASTTAAIGAGGATTITFDFGTISGGAGAFNATTGQYTGAAFASNGNGAKTLTIDSTNNSLAGIRDAINAAGLGVTATIVNDGSATPYRLALTSNSTGASNSMKITVAGDAALNSLLGQDPAAVQNMSQTTTAQDALLSVNGINVSKASNTVNDVIQGVTLNLLKTTTAATTVSVAADTASVQTSVNNFVKAYNDLHSTLTSVSGYDAATKKGGTLQGDFTVMQLETQLRSILSQSVTNSSGSLTTLSQVGVSFQRDGSLALDSAKLSNAITNNFKDIASLFAETGKASDSLINYTSVTSNTKAGTYGVNITQLATQGTLTGSAAPVSTTIATGVNDALDVVINGTAARVTLAAGSYTAATLATMLQATINGTNTFSSSNLSVTVSQAGGAFTLTSNTYGATSSVAITGGNGLANLLGTPTQTAGVDIAGTLGGQTAIGSGQYLVGTGIADGLKIQVSGGALGARGDVTYSQGGYAYQLNKFATSLLATDGSLNGRTTGLTSTINDIGKQRTALQARLVDIEARYRAQFSRLDTMLSSMQQTQSYLTQQLNALSSITK